MALMLHGDVPNRTEFQVQNPAVISISASIPDQSAIRAIQMLASAGMRSRLRPPAQRAREPLRWRSRSLSGGV